MKGAAHLDKVGRGPQNQPVDGGGALPLPGISQSRATIWVWMLVNRGRTAVGVVQSR